MGDIGVAVIVVSEGVCGSEQVFHDEALEQSSFFRAVCNGWCCTNAAASWPGLVSSQPGLSVEQCGIKWRKPNAREQLFIKDPPWANHTTAATCDPTSVGC